MKARSGFVARDAVRVNGPRNGNQARFRDAAEDHVAKPGLIDALPKPQGKHLCRR